MLLSLNSSLYFNKQKRASVMSLTGKPTVYLILKQTHYTVIHYTTLNVAQIILFLVFAVFL